MFRPVLVYLRIVYLVFKKTLIEGLFFLFGLLKTDRENGVVLLVIFIRYLDGFSSHQARQCHI